ncbi:MAG: hypothetical protein JO102_02525 [Elusimicrobia bacterium]|nr:hypothetical protein [Elusimicrobiota bacterium]
MNECIDRDPKSAMPTALVWRSVILIPADTHYFRQKPVLPNVEAVRNSPFRRAVLVGPETDIDFSIPRLGPGWSVDSRCNCMGTTAVAVTKKGK